MDNRVDFLMPTSDAVRACGLLSFAYIALCDELTSVFRRYVAAVIVCNGIMCHLTQRWVWVCVDICVNAVLVVVTNVTSPRQPYTLLYSLSSLFVWRRFCYGVRCRGWLHVVGVQLVLAREYYLCAIHS